MTTQVKTGVIADGAVTTSKISDGAITSSKIADGTIVGDDIANTTIEVGKLSATGTPSASTFLRGDGSWEAPASSGVTSITAGTGLTGGTITTSGTIALDFYTGTTANNTSYPIGSYIAVYAQYTTKPANSASTIYSPSTNGSMFALGSNGTGSSVLTGTWRARGLCADKSSGCDTIQYYLHQRTA